MKRIGLTLGGGGVRGLAYVLILELLDALGCKPSVISGTSMGAIIGALYASGLSGKAIKTHIQKLSISKDDTWPDIFRKRADLLKWVDAFAPELGRGGLVRPDKFLGHLLGGIGMNRFEELDIPLLIVAADYWGIEEVVFEKGELLPAIKASMAVPGVFAPVSIGDRVLVDGGVVNLVPYDHIMDRCDLSIVVNAAKARAPGKREIPNVLESILGTFELMQGLALAEKLKRRPPDIYIRPEFRDVRIFDFNKIEEVFRQAAPAVEQLRGMLTEKLHSA